MIPTLFYSSDFDDWIQINCQYKKGKLADYYNDELDQAINTYLIESDEDNVKSFILPISLNGNFFDFSGLIFAHHVRLTRNIKCCDATIVFYGTMRVEQLLRFTQLARILLTENVLYFNTEKYSFEEIIKYAKESYIKTDLKRFLNQIQIDAPTNYEDNHHSVDNEFALIQWSKYIGCYNFLPEFFKKEFESQLYLKYLRNKNPVSERSASYQTSITANTSVNILLIDDEAYKGWKVFYSSLFNNFSSKINFEDSGINFKDPGIGNLIISSVESKINQFEPDIVLLDLRLIDSDFNKEKLPSDLTGLKVLEKIKELNKGIQVILTTASNKAWNINLAKEKGAYEFIIKDGFEDPEKAINKFIKTIEISSQRARYLKILYQKLFDIKDLIFSNSHLDDKDDKGKMSHEIKDDKIRKKMVSNIELAFELLDLSYKIPGKEKYLAYSYLQLFILIEDFINPNSLDKATPIIYNESDQLFISHSKKQICIFQIRENHKRTRLEFDRKYKLAEGIINFQRKIDNNFFVSSILIYKYGNENSSIKNWTSVYTIRNKVAHEGYTPKENEIKELLDFMLYLFNNSNENDNNLERGLQPITYDESLRALSAKYKRR